MSGIQFIIGMLSIIVALISVAMAVRNSAPEVLNAFTPEQEMILCRDRHWSLSRQTLEFVTTNTGVCHVRHRLLSEQKPFVF